MTLSTRKVLIFALLVAGVMISACSKSEKSETAKIEQAPVDAMRTLLPGHDAIDDLTLRDTTTLYDRNTVWDYLSQRSEIYLNNGMVELAAGTYVSGGPDSLKIELIRYSETVYAFAMFAYHRTLGSKILDIPTESYLLGDTVAVLKGHFEVRLVRFGSIEDETLIETAKSIADKISDKANALPPQLALFPAEGKIPHTEDLHIMDVFERTEFPEFFGSHYIVNGDTLKFHFMIRAEGGLATATDAYIGEKGTVSEWLMEGQISSLVGTSAEFGTVYCGAKDSNLVVVTGYDDIKNAKEITGRFLAGLPK
jgi:hypothetical protein